MMSLDEILIEVRKMNRADQLKVMQAIVLDMAHEEDALLMPGTTYDLPSPIEAFRAAQVMLDMLKADEDAQDG